MTYFVWEVFSVFLMVRSSHSVDLFLMRSLCFWNTKCSIIMQLGFTVFLFLVVVVVVQAQAKTHT